MLVIDNVPTGLAIGTGGQLEHERVRKFCREQDFANAVRPKGEAQGWGKLA